MRSKRLYYRELSKEETGMETVSIIIPVYNVEKYIDQCMESVIQQTYRCLEIIIVYDKCRDNSYEHCLDWCKRDSRVRLIVNQNRGGLAAARNQGLLEASGEYVLFVDSDDWLDTGYVQALCNVMAQTKADYVTGSSYYEASDKTVRLMHGMPAGMYQTAEMKAILLCGDFVTMWKKLYRREWLLANRLLQPELFHYEDWGTYPLMVANAETVAVSAFPGVYYRVEREGCLSLDDEAALLRDFKNVLHFMFDALDRYGKWELLEDAIKYYCLRDFYTRYFLNLKSGNLDAAAVLDSIHRELLIPRFGVIDVWKPKYLVLGSFSLRWEVQKGCLVDARVDSHFCFSSLISIFAGKCEREVFHENPFRKKQIEQELESELQQALVKTDKETYFFLDFMEERFAVLDLGQGIYITESDALRESNLQDLEYVRRIEGGSDEYMKLWKQACEQLIALLKKCLRPEQIIMVRNRMSFVYGDLDHKQFFENEHEIRKKNQIMEAMENFFIERMPGIEIIESDSQYLFADDKFRMGCDPMYANNAWYTKVGLQIFKILFREHI